MSIIKTVRLFFKNKFLQFFDDEKILNETRKHIHIIEKNDKEFEILDVILAKKLFNEAKNRNLLSHSEIIWGQKILFGYVNNKSNYYFDCKIDNIIKNRRSTRFWTEEKITEKQIKKLVNVVRWTPSSRNRQPWYLIFTNDKQKIRELANLRGQKFLQEAPNCIIFLINERLYERVERDYTPYLDAGAAIQNLLLKAEEMDLSACWINYGIQQVNSSGQIKTKKMFNIPDKFNVVSLVPIGKSNKKSLPPGRKKVEDLFSYDRINI